MFALAIRLRAGGSLGAFQTQTDHVRTAVGRNRLDATPTSGTIFVGGGGETLAVEVSVEPHG